jgi:hypothetical protein
MLSLYMIFRNVYQRILSFTSMNGHYKLKTNDNDIFSIIQYNRSDEYL